MRVRHPTIQSNDIKHCASHDDNHDVPSTHKDWTTTPWPTTSSIKNTASTRLLRTAPRLHVATNERLSAVKHATVTGTYEPW